MKIYLPKYDAVIQIDDDDLPIFSMTRWRILRPNGHQYVSGRVGGKHCLLHRLITNAPKGLVVDHIDGNGLNNRRSNLRVVTQQKNLWNRNMSKEKGGVIFRKGRWEAGIHFDGRYIQIGTYPNETEAKRARDYFSARARGSFGSLHGVDVHQFDPLTMSYTARRVLAEMA